ncbi:MAG: hypothetical protein J6Y80_06850, partial [Victivallales bacterium]|nr:hypothetical protein [Victivallales bacterium]
MKVFLASLLLSLVVLGAELSPLRPDFFRQGCGGDGQGSYYLPVLSNDGRVAAVAPWPDSPYSVSAPQRCGYLLSADGQSVTPLSAPGPEFMGKVFYRALISLGADEARSRFWGGAQVFTGGTNVDLRLVFFDCADGAVREPQDLGIACTAGLQARLLPAADGSCAFLHIVDNSDEPLPETGFYALDGASLTPLQAVSLPNDAGFAPAFATGGGAIYYVGENETASTDQQKMLAIYRYDVGTGRTERLEDIGFRTSLKVYDSHYLKEVPMVVSSVDGAVVAYRWANGVTAEEGGVQLRVASRDALGRFAFDFASRNSGADGALLADAEGVDCQFPAISADGRFVAFTAKAGTTVRQAWRYDRRNRQLEVLSSGLAADCHATALSPNGRYAAFVAPYGKKNLPQLYRVDCGPAVTPELIRTTVGCRKSIPLEVKVVAREGATLAVSGISAGAVIAQGGSPVLENVQYPLDSLPWTFAAGAEPGEAVLQLTVTEGARTATAELAIMVSNFQNLSSAVLSRSAYYSYDYADLQVSADGGQAVFVTDAPLDPSDDAHTQDVYRLDLGTGLFELLSGSSRFSANVYSPAFSGDGKQVFWIDQEGALWRNGEDRLAADVNLFTVPAVSHDGITLAIRQGDALLRSTDGGASWTQVAVTAARENAVYSTPRLSFDGRVLWFAVREDEILSLYSQTDDEAPRLIAAAIREFCGITLDGAQALVRLADGELAWVTVNGARPTRIRSIPAAQDVVLSANGRFTAFTMPGSAESARPGIWLADLQASGAQPVEIASGADGASLPLAFSDSGKQLFFASDATNLLPGEADKNDERDLFLYENPDWSNALPGAPIYTAHNLQEDLPEPARLRMGLRDNDGDALVPALDTTATRGDAALMPPGEGRLEYLLSYQPPQDFCGTDTVQVRSWDGAGWSAWTTVKLVVANVNDPPVWDTDTPVALELPAGESLQVILHATDVDERNPTPDVLRYSLAANSPGWATVDSASGELVLLPGFGDSGDFTLTA